MHPTKHQRATMQLKRLTTSTGGISRSKPYHNFQSHPISNQTGCNTVRKSATPCVSSMRRNSGRPFHLLLENDRRRLRRPLSSDGIQWYHTTAIASKPQPPTSTTHDTNNNSMSTTNTMTHTPVVIVGGGPTGLFLSILLSQYGIPSTLIESRLPSQIARHPQAHYLNLRTMELLRHNCSGAYARVRREMPDVGEWEGFTFGHSVMGRQMARVVHPVRGVGVGRDGKGVLVTADAGGGGGAAANGRRRRQNTKHGDGIKRCSVCDPGHLAQNKFSSILLDEARIVASNLNSSVSTPNHARLPGITRLIHGVTVTSITEPSSSQPTSPPQQQQTGTTTTNTTDGPLTVTTSNGQSFLATYVIAADGSSSSLRQIHTPSSTPPFSSSSSFSHNPNMGNPTLQHLTNVHFRTSPSLSRRLMSRVDATGMLHFVFHPSLVGVFVCHDGTDGEWVLQIPYFPPFQSLKEDFTKEKVRALIADGLGVVLNDNDNDDMGTNEETVEILSVRSWTMGATVSRRYRIGTSQRIVLAGDAAHVFPPAGGFGMNTGLQDAHALAWRLALALGCRGLLGGDGNGSGGGKDGGDGITTTSTEGGEVTATGTKVGRFGSLRLYETERRPIAARNAALSVRNYQRTLDVARACFLDADHPAFLTRVLDTVGSVIPFVPLSVRRSAFRTAMVAAMGPLNALATEGNPYGDMVTNRLRGVLGSGGGLPLLFPRYEIGFRYGSGDEDDDDDKEGANDTAGYVPEITVGKRLPHVPLRLVGRRRMGSESSERVEEIMDPFHYLEENGNEHGGDNFSEGMPLVTLTDIESQLGRRWDHPTMARFTLIVTGRRGSPVFPLVQDVASLIWSDTGIHVVVLEVYRELDFARERLSSLPCDGSDRDDKSSAVVLLDATDELRSLLIDGYDSNEDGDCGNADYVVAVRPDGHVAMLNRYSDKCFRKSGIKQLADDISDGLIKVIDS